jgi:hypothetical protein
MTTRGLLFLLSGALLTALAAALNGPQHIIRIRASLDRVLGMLDG